MWYDEQTESVLNDIDFPEHLRHRAAVTMIQAGVWPVWYAPGIDPTNHKVSYTNERRGFGPRNEGCNERAGDWDKVKYAVLPWLKLSIKDRGDEWGAYYRMLNKGQLRLNAHKHVSEELFFKWVDEYDTKQRTEECAAEEDLIAKLLATGQKSMHIANALMAGAYGYKYDVDRGKYGLLQKIYRTKRKMKKGVLPTDTML